MSSQVDFVVALAWPETYCKQASAWYDPLMRWIGFNRQGYYQVGHAAVVLVDGETGECSYFDFGRYHSPFGYGRVRSVWTDPELKVLTRADIQGGRLLNMHNLLTELSENPFCHGEGVLCAGCYAVSGVKSTQKRIKAMQEKGLWTYGPFARRGTNCSRFVRHVLLSSVSSWRKRWLLRLPWMVTPSPMYLVRLGDFGDRLQTEGVVHVPKECAWGEVLSEPNRPPDLPRTARWLSGEGAGSWYCISQVGTGFHIVRYDCQGREESRGIYVLDHTGFDASRAYELVCPSHYRSVSVRQENTLFCFSLQAF
ncbi:hypothetical protein BFP72_00640 [Reichenbachiella sp. 5M10]|uniref:DUF6695 family protein n=1 Tax=Reichenbachiella sp. 5M10 TaxID=1889772 RepID=UPI000C156A50|nr:DUF6695 family protein [Reichenbachiella sp. 5M10]PIB34040.1 hypothetical protein BFP72_00640 [Reichenbachiella sp. 5M10]